MNVANENPLNPMVNYVVPLSLVGNYSAGCGAFNGRINITLDGETLTLAPNSPHTETLSLTEMLTF